MPFGAQDKDASVPYSPTEDSSLDEVIASFTSALREDAAYRPPEQDESRVTAQTINLLSQRDPETIAGARATLDPLGFTTRTGVDAKTGRGFIVIANERASDRAWGLYVIDTTEQARVVVEVPHPAFDLRTEVIGLELFRARPGMVLAMAGTHRRVAGGAGDVAHRADSMFHAVTRSFAMRGLPQIQLHGFDDASLAGVDVVLSPSATKTTDALRDTASRIEDDGFSVCRAWREPCGNLEGRRNEQGVTAAEHDATFVHVEINKTVRDDPGRWAAIVAVLDAELVGD
ncbi:MAG: hypothetical protein M3548_11465, partial [Actinomycetota bacterium]|nr:hypothetical protein [Actinomycetota bacterium]